MCRNATGLKDRSRFYRSGPALAKRRASAEGTEKDRREDKATRYKHPQVLRSGLRRPSWPGPLLFLFCEFLLEEIFYQGLEQALGEQIVEVRL